MFSFQWKMRPASLETFLGHECWQQDLSVPWRDVFTFQKVRVKNPRSFPFPVQKTNVSITPFRKGTFRKGRGQLSYLWDFLNWKIVYILRCVSLGYTMYWLDTFICYNMITTSLMSHDHFNFVVGTIKI